MGFRPDHLLHAGPLGQGFLGFPVLHTVHKAVPVIAAAAQVLQKAAVGVHGDVGAAVLLGPAGGGAQVQFAPQLVQQGGQGVGVHRFQDIFPHHIQAHRPLGVGKIVVAGDQDHLGGKPQF